MANESNIYFFMYDSACYDDKHLEYEKEKEKWTNKGTAMLYVAVFC